MGVAPHGAGLSRRIARVCVQRASPGDATGRGSTVAPETSDRTYVARRLPGWLAAPIVGAGFVTLFAGAAQFGVTATLGDVAVAFDVATSAEADGGSVGMTTGALGVGLAVIRFAGAGALFGSVFADRLGRRTVLLGASAIGLFATGVATFMPTFWAFVALLALGRPLLTTTNAIVPVVAAEEATTENRTAAIAFMSAAYAAGAGLVSVARSIGDGLGYRTVLLGVAALSLTLPFVGRLVRDSPTSVKHADAERPAFGLVDREYVRPLVVISLLGALTNVVTGPALTFLFLFGEQVLGESPGDMAMLVFLAGPVGLGGLLAGRWAGDRIGRRTTSMLGTAAAPVAAVYAYSGDASALHVGYLTMVFFLAFLGPPVGALLNEVVPTETRATANGWVGATAVFGGVAGLTGFGFLVDALPSYQAAASALFLPVVPLALGYYLVKDEQAPDIAEIDRTIRAEYGGAAPAAAAVAGPSAPGTAADATSHVDVPTDE